MSCYGLAVHFFCVSCFGSYQCHIPEYSDGLVRIAEGGIASLFISMRPILKVLFPVHYFAGAFNANKVLNDLAVGQYILRNEILDELCVQVAESINIYFGRPG